MIGSIRKFSPWRQATLALVFAALPAVAQAASLSHPPVGPIVPGYTFTDILESSVTDGVPLYGPGSPISVGLSFSPTPGFVATSMNGGADLTDGQVNFTITASPTAGGINVINLSEGGLYSLLGIGTPITHVEAGAILRATVLEINGLPVSPIDLTPASASVSYNLVANPGPLQLWDLDLSLDVTAQLILLGFSPNEKATKTEVVIDNALIAISEASTVATISKTDFEVTLTPEPTSFALLGMALCGLGFARVGRKGR